MRFTITSQVKGNASRLRHYIAEACSEVREVMEAAVGDESSGLGRAGKL